MREGWRTLKLSKVCRLVNGRAYKKTELLSEGKYPVLRVGNLFTNNQWYYSDLELDEHKYCDNGDLIYAWSASFGPRIWDGDKVIYHYHIWKVLPDFNYVSRDFLYHLFEWDKEQIKSAHGTGTTMMHVGKSSMENRLAPIPPISEQEQIVEILEDAFAAIDQAKANIEKNILNAKELFQSKLDEIFNQNDNNWKYEKLGELCKTGAGGTPLKSRKENYENGTIPWLRSGEVNNRNIINSKIKISKTGLNNSSAKLFPPRTVLIAMYGATAGQVGILNFECSTNQAVCGILPNDKFIPEFLYYKFLEGKEALIKQAVGGAQPNISQLKIKNTLIPNINLKAQEQAVKILDYLTAQRIEIETNYKTKINNLEELKKSILQKAFAGELTQNEITI